MKTRNTRCLILAASLMLAVSIQASGSGISNDAGPPAFVVQLRTPVVQVMNLDPVVHVAAIQMFAIAAPVGPDLAYVPLLLKEGPAPPLVVTARNDLTYMTNYTGMLAGRGSTLLRHRRRTSPTTFASLDKAFNSRLNRSPQTETLGALSTVVITI